MPAGQTLQAVALLRSQQVMQPVRVTQRLERIVPGIRVPAPPQKHLCRFDGQGRIEEDLRRELGLVLHDGQQVQDQFLGPADGEGRHQQGTPGGLGRTQLPGQGVASRGELQVDPFPVAVGAFQDDVIDADRTGGRGQERLSP